MENDLRRTDDRFREKIMEMLAADNGFARTDFRSRVFEEVQNYSRELQEIDHASDLFFTLCGLIVDCQFLSVPNDTFKTIVACLLCRPQDAMNCPTEEVKKLIGLNIAGFEAAQDQLKSRQCIVSALNKGKSGPKASRLNGKRNFSRAHKSDILA
ncbi:MAG: hypothetical protein ACP5IL_06790 [Syntrophobacteraceae bacterium]